MKKYALPIENNLQMRSIIANHFGHAPAFAVVNDDKELIKIIYNTSVHFGGKIQSPELLKNQKIDVLLCKALGPNAIKLFEQFGIQVFIGAKKSVSKTIDLFHSGKLTMATNENACKAHRH